MRLEPDLSIQGASGCARLAGAVLADEHVSHRFTIEHGLIQAMEVCPLSSSGLGT